MSDKNNNEEAIFKAAVRLKTAAEQKAYVQNACGSDSELLARVTSLLEVSGSRNSILDVLIAEPEATRDDLPVSEAPGTVIGRYKLLERIGEGGMAVVYMAEQAEPIRRKVALKIIKLGMDTKAVIARFEAERQALAMMDHPNIAKVLDAGATETGRPYFVMELVKGVAITEYCDQHELSVDARLALFSQVCHAVRHAHQKGIIHRDIKPSNVMVAQQDTVAVPKIIDFGIAKAINRRLTEKTLFTHFAQIIGTPAYMSPEQAEFNDLDVDTRTDIYSLGILLYELLTSTTPYSEEELCQAGYLGMQRVIREEEPVRPSTKLSTMGAALTDIARQRHVTPEFLRKTIQGDLDWIVMKTLEKDRVRRYETVDALAQDVQRHLRSEPVLARGPSVMYHLQKFLYRHRQQVMAGLTVFALLAALIAVVSMWFQSQRQQAKIQSDRDHSVLSEAHKAYAGGDLAKAFSSLDSILDSPHVGTEAKLLHAGILVESGYPEEAVDQLSDLLDAKPEIAGAAHALTARIIWERETVDAQRLKEIEYHQQKVDALLPATAQAYFLRAMMVVAVKDKLGWLEKALDLDRGHYESCRLRAFIDYTSKKYARMKDDALVMVAKQPQNPLGYRLRGMAQQGLGEYEGAISDYEHALRRTPEDDPQRAELHGRICEAYLCLGDYRRVIGQAHRGLQHFPTNERLHFHIFCALTARGDYEEASAYFNRIIESSAMTRSRFRNWSHKYVFDVLDAGRVWRAPHREPKGAAFLSMLEAEEDYNYFSTKSKRIIKDGFTARWSPNGTKLAYGLGMLQCSGLAIYDVTSQETELLIVPGKDPAWSPDGRFIAFTREARNLRLAELAVPEHRNRRRAALEVWIMNADGTEPRRLTQGSWPSWSQDAKYVYYALEGTLYSIAIEDSQALPQPILACSTSVPSVSPNQKHVAYVKNASLHVIDLASQSIIVQCAVPPLTWGGHWSPDSRQFSLGGFIFPEVRTGLWIYDLDTGQVTKVLSGPVSSVCWAPDASKLAFCVGIPFFDVWLTDLDPSISTIEALGPGQTLKAHYQEMADFYSRRIETDSNDVENYLHRAECFHYLHDRQRLLHDMEQHVSTLSPWLKNDLLDQGFRDFLSDLWQSVPTNVGPTVNSSANDQAPSISTNSLTLYFNVTVHRV